MRKGNTFRLPSVVDFTKPEEAAHVVDILNQAIQSFQGRLDTLQQVGAKAPVPVPGFAVQAKQGLFHLSWQKVKNVDGYVIMQASDSSMNFLTGRYNIPDGEQSTFDIPVGNSAVTASFQVYAYQGNLPGDPSPIVTGTTTTWGGTATDSSTPGPAPLAPLPPKLQMVRNGTTIA